MSHFGILPYKGSGHLNPLVALSQRLIDRGHRVTFFQKPEVESKIRQHGLEFVLIGPPKSSAAEDDRAGDRSGLSSVAALRHNLSRIAGDMEMFLREAPTALANSGVDMLIIDEIVLSGPTLAEMLRLPYFVVSTSVPRNFGWTAPCRILPRQSCFERVQDALLQVSILEMSGPVERRLDKYRQQAGLGPIGAMEMVFPALAYIAQMPECIDFPQYGLPRNFYYTGPFVDEGARRRVDFPWDRLDGRSVVYASLGTTRKSDPGIFHLIAEACHGLDLQLAISLGGRRDPEMFAGLPGDPLVVREAPQLELIKRAEVVITHGGLNTALEALMEGKPMIVIPKSFDQPAVAARLEWLGVAEALPVEGLSAEQIRVALAKVLSDPSYREAARAMQARILSACGLERAADIIEELSEKRQHANHV
jgi:zeaxanthin glucosyltransferase